MKDYKLTIEDGVITWVENTDGSGNLSQEDCLSRKKLLHLTWMHGCFLAAKQKRLLWIRKMMFFLCSQLPFEQGWKEAY